jgi:hypothetical protein
LSVQGQGLLYRTRNPNNRDFVLTMKHDLVSSNQPECLVGGGLAVSHSTEKMLSRALQTVALTGRLSWRCCQACRWWTCHDPCQSWLVTTLSGRLENSTRYGPHAEIYSKSSIEASVRSSAEYSRRVVSVISSTCSNGQRMGLAYRTRLPACMHNAFGSSSFTWSVLVFALLLGWFACLQDVLGVCGKC